MIHSTKIRWGHNTLALPLLATLPAVLDGYVMVALSYPPFIVLCEVVLVLSAIVQWVLYFQQRHLTDLTSLLQNLTDILQHPPEIWHSPRVDYKIAYNYYGLTRYHYVAAWNPADALSQARHAGLEAVQLWAKCDSPEGQDAWEAIGLPAD